MMKRLGILTLILVLVMAVAAPAMAVSAWTVVSDDLEAVVNVVAPAPEVAYDFSGYEALVEGQPAITTVNVKIADNGAISDTTPLRYRFSVTKAGAPVANLVIRYPEVGDGDNPAGWHSFTTDASGIAWFGPSAGFTLEQVQGLLTADGVTTQFQSVMSQGSYVIDVCLIDVTGPTPADFVELGEHGQVPFTVAAPLTAHVEISWMSGSGIVNPDDTDGSITVVAGTPINVGVLAVNGDVAIDKALFVMTVTDANDAAVMDGVTITAEDGQTLGKGDGYYYWGPLSTGIPMAAGYTADTVFTATFGQALAGKTLHVKIQVVQLP